jgi:hypothetical protein
MGAPEGEVWPAGAEDAAEHVRLMPEAWERLTSEARENSRLVGCPCPPETTLGRTRTLAHNANQSATHEEQYLALHHEEEDPQKEVEERFLQPARPQSFITGFGCSVLVLGLNFADLVLGLEYEA